MDDQGERVCNRVDKGAVFLSLSNLINRVLSHGYLMERYMQVIRMAESGNGRISVSSMCAFYKQTPFVHTFVDQFHFELITLHNQIIM